MGTVINLGRYRKRRQKEAEQRQADANAIQHGRTKTEKLREREDRARQQARLDGAQRDRDHGPPAQPTQQIDDPNADHDP